MSREESRFNLDVAIATWRHVMKHERAMLPEDLDELEQHVRDQTSWLMAEGLGQEEAYRRTMKEMGDQGSVQQAYRDVFWQKMRHRRSLKEELGWRWTMLRHHARLTLRNLARSKVYSGVTIAGLAIGLAAFILIGLFIRHELSYDRFFDDSDRLFRVVKQDPGSFYLGNDTFAYTPVPLPDALEAEIPGVETATQISPVSALLKAGSNSFVEDGLYARSSLFEVFSFELLSGNPETVLAGPDRIVLTESMSHLLFGDQDPIGKQVSYTWDDAHRELEVSGVVADPPSNVHFTFRYLVSMESDPWWQRGQDEWDNSDRYTYFKAAESADPAVLEAAIEELGRAKLSPLSWYQQNPDRITRYSIQHVPWIHLNSQVNFEIQPTGSMRTTMTLGFIAVIILLIACVNYINLATARSATRGREIGIRQVSGARPGQLVQQFLGESLVLTALAGSMGLAIAWLLLPSFRTLVERDLNMGLILDPYSILMLVSAFAVVWLVSGSYPALIMSRLRPAHALGGHRKQRTRSRLRSTLVVAQYAVGIVLIISTLVVQRQVGYMATADTGVSREQIVTVTIQDEGLEDQIATVLNEMRGIPEVTMAASSLNLPTNIQPQSSVVRFEGNEDESRIYAYNTGVGYDWIQLLDLEMVEGRAFTADQPADEWSGLIVNERFKEAAGWDEAVGKTMEYGGRGDHVIGVVKDFHFHSLRREIEPLVLYLAPNYVGHILVRFKADDVSGTIAQINAVMERFSPEYPFEYAFLDDAYNSLYQSEVRYARIFRGFAILAILIACLGLFALSAFMADQRRNEIGVRKALGASAFDIVRELSRDFLTLIAQAIIIGSPLAWMVMNRWLEDFAYRIEVDWTIIGGAGLLTLLVAWCTVAWQSIKAARTNPSEVLRQG